MGDVTIIFQPDLIGFFSSNIESKEIWEIQEEPDNKQKENRMRSTAGGRGREKRGEVEGEGEEEKENLEHHCTILLSGI